MAIAAGEHATAEDVLSAIAAATIRPEQLTLIPLVPTSVGQGTWSPSPFTGGVVPLNLVFYNSSNADGDNVSFKVEVKAGTYTLYVVDAKGPSMAKIDVYVDATKVISASDRYFASSLIPYFMTASSLSLTAGEHTIKIQINGKNASSSGYYAHLGYFTLGRTGA